MKINCTFLLLGFLVWCAPVSCGAFLINKVSVPPSTTFLFASRHRQQQKRSDSHACVWSTNAKQQQQHRFQPNLIVCTSIRATPTDGEPSNDNKDELDLDEKLFDMAKKFTLQIYDLDEGIFGLDSKDARFGIEVVKTNIIVPEQGGLGIVLTEMAGSADGRGLVLIRDIVPTCAAAKATPDALQVGDVLTGILVPEMNVRERTTGLNYDLTVDAVGRARAAAELIPSRTMILEVNRLVQRARVVVQIQNDRGEVIQTLESLAGENLRKLLLRKGIKLYDKDTMRFDMPYAKGDCAGEGLCGTCLVAVQEGISCLSPMDRDEILLTKGRRLSWRAACRTVIGADNKDCVLRIQLKPQSAYQNELNPGVRSLS